MRILLGCALGLLAVTGAANENDCQAGPVVFTDETIRVVSLNVAHGRGLGLNQMLQREETTRLNLVKVSELLETIDADVVALQEADGPSRWSGGFDHVEFLSDGAAYPCVIHGIHADGWMSSFGTALLSRIPFSDVLTHSFQPTPPTTTKGFSLGEILWNPGGRLDEPVKLNLLSVHLDFSRKKVREAQVAETGDVLDGREPPSIVVGDFNADWTNDDSALRKIAERGNMRAWKPESDSLGTYKDGKKRLDWILISDDLAFVSYEVSNVLVSDHAAVIAEIRLMDQ